MRRPERNIEIFSMSVLDMFASALGAFIMVAIILFPYYQETKDIEKQTEQTEEAIRKTEEDLKAAKQRIREDEQTQAQLQQRLRSERTSTAELDQCRSEALACRATLTKTFLLVAIEWAERCDIDLYIKAPGQSQRFYYSNKRLPGMDAELSMDMLDGPGVEIWQSPVATPGTYEIALNPIRISSGDEAAVVRTVIMERSGQTTLRPRTIPCGGPEVLLARVIVTPTGAVTVTERN